MKRIKFAGPTKKMIQALENEGLKVEWPKVIDEEEDLAIEATYYTGINAYEKLVLIDLRNYRPLDSKKEVDIAISDQLRQAYEAYDIDEEMKLNLGGNGAPGAVELIKDLQEAEQKLERFADVADAVASGKPIPCKEDNAEITISVKDAKRICNILDRITRLDLETKAFAEMIRKEMERKIEEA